MTVTSSCHERHTIDVRRVACFAGWILTRGWIAACLAGLLAMQGCGPKAGGPIADTEVTQPVTMLSDWVDDPKRSNDLFSERAQPSKEQRAKYANYMYFVSKIISSSATEAQLMVTVQESSGNTAGVLEWKVVKEGDRWKLESAPLP